MSAIVAPTVFDRLLAMFRALIRAELPQLTYFGTYEYSIQKAGSSTIDGSPTDTTIPLSSLTGIPLRSSLLGQVVDAQAVGGLALIRFINGDPERPVCVSILSIPKKAKLDATGSMKVGPSASKVVLNGGKLGVARVGDSVTFFLPPNSIVSGTLTAPIPPPGPTPTPFAGTLTVINGMSGIIGQGSPTVGSG